MSDVSYTGGSGSSGSDADYGGKSGGSSSLFSSPLSLSGLGTVAAGGAGLAGLFSMGETAPPWEFGQVANNASTLEGESGTLFGEGQTFTNQGAQALEMAQNGQLTQPQQAALQLYRQGLNNTAAQTYAGMGRNINQDTSGISTQANIDTEVNAMANQQIQSTIALGLGETSAGSSFSGQALGYESAANQALIAAGNAQVQADTAYSSALSGVFSALGSIAGGIGGAAIGGPAGAVAGASIGKAV